jgi:hypothetical protein
MTTTYPRSYHQALDHLIQVGVWEQTTKGRALCAAALRSLRAQRRTRKQLSWERNHLRFICGTMPRKASSGCSIATHTHNHTNDTPRQQRIHTEERRHRP